MEWEHRTSGTSISPLSWFWVCHLSTVDLGDKVAQTNVVMMMSNNKEEPKSPRFTVKQSFLKIFFFSKKLSFKGPKNLFNGQFRL